MTRRAIRVVERKLGRQKALGQAYSDGLVEIDPRQRSRGLLNTIVHECLHVLLPNASESRVHRMACSITRAAWEAGFRKIAK